MVAIIIGVTSIVKNVIGGSNVVKKWEQKYLLGVEIYEATLQKS